MRALDALHRYQQELGLSVERLTPRETRRREPSLTPRVRGGLAVSGDHSVDGRGLHAALSAAAATAGVRFVRERIGDVEVSGGRAAGLRTAGGTLVPADVVVLAMGAWSATLPSVGALPVRPVKGQILRMAGAADLLEGTVRALVRGRHVYMVPHAGDGLIVGATVEDRGFDAAVTAGGVHDLLHDAIEVVPGVTDRTPQPHPGHRVGLPPGIHQQRRARRRPCPLDRALQHSTPPERTRRATTDQPPGTNLMTGYTQRSANHTFAPEFNALRAIFGSAGPVISSRRSVRSAGPGATVHSERARDGVAALPRRPAPRR